MTIRSKPIVDVKLSALLDTIRVVAAVYVVIHHVFVHLGWEHGFGLIFRFGQEAVIVFFRLSGFVIYINEAWRENDWRGYYRRRLIRLYPPLICAILLSALIAIDNGNAESVFHLRSLFGTLFMLQDISALKPGVIIDPYLNNAPLWSLSYEALFYIAFPLISACLLKAPHRTVHGVGVVCIASYLLYVALPNHWTLVVSYFAIWWVGALAGRLYVNGRRSAPELTIATVYLCLTALLSGLAVIGVGFVGVGVYPFLSFRHFAAALIFLPLGIAIGRFGARYVPSHAVPTIKWMASISYGLYIFHFPLLTMWSRAGTGLGLIAAATVLVLCSYLFDRRLSMLLRAHFEKSRAQ